MVVVTRAQISLGMKLIWMNLGIKLIFCMCLGIQKYIYLIQPIHVGVIRHIWAFQDEFAISNLQYTKTKLTNVADFLHMDRLQKKEQIDTVISSGLTAWVLTQDVPWGSV